MMNEELDLYVLLPHGNRELRGFFLVTRRTTTPPSSLPRDVRRSSKVRLDNAAEGVRGGCYSVTNDKKNIFIHFFYRTVQYLRTVL